MAAVVVRQADAGDVAPLARVLTRAYADDPLLSWYVRGRGRAARMERFFAASIRPMIRRRLRHVLTTADRAGVAFWARPGSCALPVVPMLPAVPALAWSARLGVARGARVARIVEARHPPEPHWYLETLATDPASQRRGVATALMTPVLARCDREGVPAVLETQKPENVGFYERRGFAISGEVVLPGGGPHLWLMRRDPNA